MIQGISGPGGIGKSALWEHALNEVDVSSLGYLVIRIDGQDAQGGGLANAISRAIENAKIPESIWKNASKKMPKSTGSYFPALNQVLAVIDEIKAKSAIQATTEATRSGESLSADDFGRFFDAAITVGMSVNQMSPKTVEYFNFQKLREEPLLQNVISELLPLVSAIRTESPGFLNKLGIGGGYELRNAVRENAAERIAQAFFSDLTAILAGYQGSDFYKPKLKKVKGLERLLLIVDDFEFVRGTLDAFLIQGLLPRLRDARFKSLVAILGRDALASSHPEFDSKDYSANMLDQIHVERLSREELGRLLSRLGIDDKARKDQAWSDTEGYPYYVHQWVAESQQGGITAETLRRFNRRITLWLSEKQKKWLEPILFMDDVNIESLGKVLGKSSEAKAALDWFQSEASLRDPSTQRFKVREYVRVRLRQYLEISNPERFRELSSHSTQLDNDENALSA